MIVRPVSMGQAYMVGEEYEEKALVVVLRDTENYQNFYCLLHNMITCIHTDELRNQ